MTIIWTAFFVSILVYANSQYIYENVKDDCSSNEKNTGTISTLLTELRKIQREVDQLLQENMDIRYLLKCPKLNTDCKELYVSGYTQSGVYIINPFCNENQISVYCDMVTEGGGWTAIQKRISGSVNFNKSWTEYRIGFGNPNDSYWIGNDVIHQLTKERKSSLYVSITLQNGTTLYELYHQFFVSGEEDDYKIFLGGSATGSLGDSMSSHYYNLSGMPFSSPDRDNDRSKYNCAVSYGGGGWWFNSCTFTFLNGPWSSRNWYNPWDPTVTDGREIKETFMMIKGKGDSHDD